MKNIKLDSVIHRVTTILGITILMAGSKAFPAYATEGESVSEPQIIEEEAEDDAEVIYETADLPFPEDEEKYEADEEPVIYEDYGVTPFTEEEMTLEESTPEEDIQTAVENRMLITATMAFSSSPTKTWDISSAGNGSITAYWYADTRELVIKGTGAIKDYSSSPFSSESSITSDNFTVVFADDSNITYIGKRVFEDMTTLKNVTMPDRSTAMTIGERAFNECSDLEYISLSSGITSIGDTAFYHCKNLMLESLPDNITNIGQNAFMGDTGVTLTVLPSKLKTLGQSAFSSSGIAISTLPKTLTKIQYRAFGYCSNLPSTFTIPGTVKTIENYGFAGNPNITTIIYDGTLNSSVGDRAFYVSTKTNTVLITDDTKLKAYNRTGSNRTLIDFWDVSAAQDVSVIAAYDPDTKTLTISGTGAMKDYSSEYSLPYSSQSWKYSCEKAVIGSGVTNIGSYIFYNFYNLKSYECADTVTAIDSNAFTLCTDLTEIYIPPSVKTIGAHPYPLH